MIGRLARCLRYNAFKPTLRQIERIDECIDRANRIALIDPLIQAFGQQSQLPAIRTNQEALHRFPPANREENHNIHDVFTQPGSLSELSPVSAGSARSLKTLPPKRPSTISGTQAMRKSTGTRSSVGNLSWRGS